MKIKDPELVSDLCQARVPEPTCFWEGLREAWACC